MTDYRLTYQEMATVIGEVCLLWTAIEEVIHDTILHLAAVMHPEFWDREKKVWDLVHIALSQMDIRQKIAVAKVYAHHIPDPDPADFYDRTESLLNYVDNVVRPERNHYVHDSWAIEGSEIMRSKLRAVVRWPQSHQRVADIWTHTRYKDIAAMRQFINNLELLYEDLVDVDNVTANLGAPREKRGAQPPQFPPEWRSLAHRDWRSPDRLQHQPEPAVISGAPAPLSARTLSISCSCFVIPEARAERERNCKTLKTEKRKK